MPLPKRQILDSSKLKKFADDNFKFDENGRNFSKTVENTTGNGEIARYEQFSFSHSVFKNYVLQTRKNKGLFGKWSNLHDSVTMSYGRVNVFPFFNLFHFHCRLKRLLQIEQIKIRLHETCSLILDLHYPLSDTNIWPKSVSKATRIYTDGKKFSKFRTDWVLGKG